MSRASLTLLCLASIALLSVPGCGGPATAVTKSRPAVQKPSEDLAQPKPKKPRTRGVTGSAPDAPGDAPAPSQPPPRPSPKPEPRAAPPPTGVVTGGPALSFSFSPKKAKAGAKITLTLNAPVSGVEVFFAGAELTSTSKDGGKVLVVTLPKDASSGYLELRVNGQTFKASRELEVQ